MFFDGTCGLEVDAPPLKVINQIHRIPVLLPFGKHSQRTLNSSTVSAGQVENRNALALKPAEHQVCALR